VRFSGPSTTRTRQRPQTPIPPHEFPKGALARRATSRIVSFGLAAALLSRGEKVTRMQRFCGIAQLSTIPVVYRCVEQVMKSMDETRLAEEIVSVLPTAALRACTAERDVIRYAVRGKLLKLRAIILDRAALRRLLKDAAAAVKIEYLKRDLLRSAATRIEYRYPRLRLARRQTIQPMAWATIRR